MENLPMAGSTKGVTLYKPGKDRDRDESVVDEKGADSLKAERKS